MAPSLQSGEVLSPPFKPGLRHGLNGLPRKTQWDMSLYVSIQEPLLAPAQLEKRQKNLEREKKNPKDKDFWDPVNRGGDAFSRKGISFFQRVSCLPEHIHNPRFNNEMGFFNSYVPCSALLWTDKYIYKDIIQ